MRWMLLCTMVIGFLMPITSASAASGTVVAGSLVNVRSCARLDCAVIGQAELGANLNVTGALVNGFLPIAWTAASGYVYAAFVDRWNDDPWFREGDVSCNRVALIFNIGIGYTPSQTVLDTLVQKQAPATMFPMGWWAEQFPNYLRQLDAAGFVIGTHGDQRQVLTPLGDAAIRKDVNDSVVAIESVLGHQIDEYFTPYAADSNLRVRRNVGQLGLLPVGWGVSAADYDENATEQYVYSRVMNGIYPGAIVEFHLDGPATATSTAKALPRIIDALRAQGYQLSTVPDLLAPCSPPVTSNWPTSGTIVGTDGAGVRCRANPSTSGAILGQLSEGTKVTLRGKVFNSWYPVNCGGQNGWSSATYIRVASGPTPAPTQPPVTPTRTPVTPTPTRTPSPTVSPVPGASIGTVTNTGGASLRCRSGAGTSYAVITELAAGSKATVRGATVSGWVPIRCANQNGWVSADYLTITGGGTPTPATPVSPTPTSPPGQVYGKVANTGGVGLNCRATASSSGTIIATVAEGTRVELRGATASGWVPVRCGGRDGWMSASYLNIPA